MATWSDFSWGAGRERNLSRLSGRRWADRLTRERLVAEVTDFLQFPYLPLQIYRSPHVADARKQDYVAGTRRFSNRNAQRKNNADRSLGAEQSDVPGEG